MPPFQSLLTVRWLTVKIFCSWKRLEQRLGFWLNIDPCPLPAVCCQLVIFPVDLVTSPVL
jgi:hypothetical protein